MNTRDSFGTALVALATLAVAGATLVLGVVRAVPAAAAADCVAVIVDARRLGGTLETGCAQGDPANGLTALTAAGFSYAPRPRDGLICQIDARPACADSTASTYWSYWYREPGSSKWVYANQGSGTHNPKPGSTEAWVWQDGGKAAPPAMRAETICPQLASSTASPSKTPTRKPGRTSTSSAAVTGAPTKTPTRKASASPGRRTTKLASPTPPPSLTTTTGRQTTPTSGSSPVPSPSSSAVAHEDGGALGGVAAAAVGGVVVAGLATASVLRARRNRP